MFIVNCFEISPEGQKSFVNSATFLRKHQALSYAKCLERVGFIVEILDDSGLFLKESEFL